MRSVFPAFFIMILVSSCKSRQGEVNISGIASLTYEAENKYLDNTIENYSTQSEKGAIYWKELAVLEERAKGLTQKLSDKSGISLAEQSEFIDYFSETFNKSVYVDFDKLQEMKLAPLQSEWDINLLKLYIKNCFVAILNDNKLLPFDTWSTMGTASKWAITKGEEFNLWMNITACNSKQPAEWFIIKDGGTGLTQANIQDTLHPNEFGQVEFRTKNYHKGENQITVVTRLSTSHGERLIYKTYLFQVN